MDATSSDTQTAAQTATQAGPMVAPILYAVGPGDAAAYFRNRRDGRLPAFHTALAFSYQFFEAFGRKGHPLYILSWCGRAERLAFGEHVIENLPRHPAYFRGGLWHHLEQVVYGLRVVVRARRFGARTVIVDSGTTHWIVLALLSLFRVPVVAVLFNALWAAGYRPTTGLHRLIEWTDGWFFRHCVAAVLPMSPEIERQIVAVSGGRPHGPQFLFAPLYRREFFERIPGPPPWDQRPFRVLYLGRVERYKGVFDVLTMAETLDRETPDGYRWRIVGEGSDFDALASEVARRNLSHLVSVEHNMASEEIALATLGWSHANIVPTRHEFKEGLAMTAVEAILTNRPVVLTEVVPAWEVLPGACLKAPTDDVPALTDAMRRLATDRELYQRLSQACRPLQATYYDPEAGLAGALGRALRAIGRG